MLNLATSGGSAGVSSGASARVSALPRTNSSCVNLLKEVMAATGTTIAPFVVAMKPGAYRRFWPPCWEVNNALSFSMKHIINIGVRNLCSGSITILSLS